MKKVLCAVLVAVMVMGLAIPAFAADQDINKTDETKVTLTTSTAVAPVKVTIKDGAGVVFNPYKQKYFGDNAGIRAMFNAESSAKFTQFLSPSVEIKSETAGMLSLKVKAKATVTSGIEVADKPVSWESKSPAAKKLFAYVSFFADSGDFKLHSGDFKNGSADFSGTVAKPSRPNMVAFTTGGELFQTPIFYFTEGSGDGATAQKGYFRIVGDASTAPETPWSDKDKFTPELSFTFTPVAEIKTPEGKQVEKYMISASSDNDATTNHSAD